MAGASGLSGATCVLCPAPAAVFCRNDGVLLCADCDVHTHSSSDYLSRHERVPLLYLPPADRARVIGGDCVGMLSIPVTSESLSHAPAAAAARQMPPATAPVQHTAGQHNAQPSLTRNKSFQVSGRAAHPISSSPFSFLSKLQPPPTLPALPLQHQHQLQLQRQQLLAATSMQRAGSSAGSDDTLWHELPPAQAARLYGGNLDATLRDCLEAFAGEHQLDLRLKPEAATCGIAHMAGGSQACDNGPSALLSTSSAGDGLYRQHSAADDLFDSVRHQLYSAAVAAKAPSAEHRSGGAGRPTTGLPHANPFAARQLAMAGRQAGTAVSSPAGDSFEQELRQAADRLMLQQQQQQQALLRHQDLERQQRQQQQQQQMELLRLRHLQQLCHQQQQIQQHSPSHALQQQQAAAGRPQAGGPFGVAHFNPATFFNPVLRPEPSDFGVTAAPHGSPASACAATSAAAAAAAEPLIERGGSCLWPAAALVHNQFNRATSAPLHAAIASLSSPRAQAAAGGSCFAGSPKPSAAAPPARLSPAAPASSVLPAEAALKRGASTVLPAEPPVRIQVAQPEVLAAAAPPAVGSGICCSPTAAQPGSPFKSPPSRPLGVQRPRRSSAVAAAVKTAAMMAAEAEAEPSEPPQSPAAAGTVAEAKQRPQTAALSPAAQHLAASGSGELADKDHPMHSMHIVVPQYREGESRAEKLERYRAKKLRRKFQPVVRYQCRKHYADARPRVKGRFVSPDEFAAWQESQGAKSAC